MRKAYAASFENCFHHDIRRKVGQKVLFLWLWLTA